MVTRDAGGEARVAGVRAEQTDVARAKRASGDWFLAKARSSRAGAGEDEARATRSAEERRASRGFVAVSQKSARQKRLMRNRAPSLRLPAKRRGRILPGVQFPMGLAELEFYT